LFGSKRKSCHLLTNKGSSCASGLEAKTSKLHMEFVDKEGGLAGCKMLEKGIFCSAKFLFSSKHICM
jgi:hypothetical protein